jgi:hypothetical protein
MHSTYTDMIVANFCRSYLFVVYKLGAFPA